MCIQSHRNDFLMAILFHFIATHLSVFFQVKLKRFYIAIESKVGESKQYIIPCDGLSLFIKTSV